MDASCLVSSYLFITFLGSGALFIIQSFQNGVLAELFLDVQNGRLYFALFGKPFLFFPLLGRDDRTEGFSCHVLNGCLRRSPFYAA